MPEEVHVGAQRLVLSALKPTGHFVQVLLDAEIWQGLIEAQLSSANLLSLVP